MDASLISNFSLDLLNNYCCINLSPYHSPSEAVVERSASSVSCQYSVASSSSDRGEMVRGLLAESPKVTLASGAGIAGVSGVSTFPVISRSVGLVLGDSGVAINCSSIAFINVEVNLQRSW
jgi:hypothetical protein